MNVERRRLSGVSWGSSGTEKLGALLLDLFPLGFLLFDSFRLVVAWILAALAAGRDYPVMVFGGEPGSAKSTATRYARSVVDPNAAPRGPPSGSLLYRGGIAMPK